MNLINQILEIKIIYEWYLFYEVFCSYFLINLEIIYCKIGCIYLRVLFMIFFVVDCFVEEYLCYNFDDIVEKEKFILKKVKKWKKER